MQELKQFNIPPQNLDNLDVGIVLAATLPPGVPFTSPAANLGKFRIETPTTSAKVLEAIRDTYGLYSRFLPDGTLSVGFPYDVEQVATAGAPVLEFGRNIIDDTNLFFQREEDQLVKLLAVSIFSDNSKIEVEVGDPNGEQRTLYVYEVPATDLRTYATNQLSRFKYKGYTGSLTLFAEPKVTVGEAVEIRNPEFPEKDGFYLVRSVTTRFGANGGVQEVELDVKIDE